MSAPVSTVGRAATSADSPCAACASWPPVCPARGRGYRQDVYVPARMIAPAVRAGAVEGVGLAGRKSRPSVPAARGTCTPAEPDRLADRRRVPEELSEAPGMLGRLWSGGSELNWGEREGQRWELS